DLGVFLLNLVFQGVNLLVHQRNLLLIKGNLFGELGLVGLLLVDLALEVGNFAVDIVQLDWMASWSAWISETDRAATGSGWAADQVNPPARQTADATAAAKIRLKR